MGTLFGGSSGGEGGGTSSSTSESTARQATYGPSAQGYQAQSDYLGGLQENVALLNPFLSAGTGATSMLQQLLGSPQQAASMVQNDPSYQFRFDQGQKALEASAAAKGLTGTGGFLKSLVGYGQDFASQEYSNMFNRLFQTSQMGQNAANQSLAYNAQLGMPRSQAIAGTAQEWSVSPWTTQSSSQSQQETMGKNDQGSFFGNLLGRTINAGVGYMTGGAAGAASGFLGR